VAYRRNVEKRLDRKEKNFESDQLMKVKRSEEYEALEEVFDRSTLMVVYDFMNKGMIDEIHGVVKEGKEARVYWGKDKYGKELAVKIYLTLSREFRKGIMRYIEGDPRFKNVKPDTRSLVFTWAQKEFKNLEQATLANVRVPRPIAVKNNVLIMEFIGENGVTAPSLKELTPPNPTKVYNKLVTYLQRLYRKADLVHGDMSEYNIMMWKEQPLIFDMSQAVPTMHPMANLLLKRDLTNLNRFFKRLDVDVLTAQDAYESVTGHGET